jgi:hypothetical protein
MVENSPELRLSARERARQVYLEALPKLTDDELRLEFRFRDSMPDFRREIEAEMQRRKKGGLRTSAKA